MVYYTLVVKVKPKTYIGWDCPKCKTPFVLWKSALETLRGYSHTCPLCGESWEVSSPDEVYTSREPESKD